MSARCRRPLAWAVALLAAVGCEKITEPGQAALPPQARAGADGQAAAGTEVVLDGSASADPEGGGLQYAWIQVSGPASVGIRGADAARASALLARAGEYVFRLTVTGGSGQSASDEVRMVAVESPEGDSPASGSVDGPPQAAAGLDLQVVVGSAATLDGTGSGDAESAVLQYAWVQVSGPEAVAIRGADSAKATVVALLPGLYVFRLTVTDASGRSASDELRLVAVDSPGSGGPASDAGPWASAGADAQAWAGDQVGLDGTGSGEPAGGELRYAWVQVSGPGVVAIRDADAARATAVLAEAGEYVFRLTVTSGSGRSATDEVRVVARDEPAVETPSEYGSVAVVTASVPAGASRVAYLLTAADLDTLRGELEIDQDQTASGVIDSVRAGPERILVVLVYGADGALAQTGTAAVRVLPQERTDVRVELVGQASPVGRLDIEGVVQPQPGYLEPGNRALSLDGAGDFMSIRPPALALDPGRSDAAVELWLAAEKLPVAGGDGQVVLGAGAVGEATPFALRIRASGATATLYAPAWRQGQDDVAVGPVEEFVPVHVALVFRNGFLMAYWNGKLAGTAERADGQGASAGGLLVGAAMGPGGEPAEFLKGQVDELRVWRRALSREEIRAHMGGGLAGVEPDLAAYWSFDDLSGDGGVPDLSGQGLDGVLVGDAHVAPWPARR